MPFQTWFHNDKKVANSQTKEEVLKKSKRNRFRDLIDRNSPKGALPGAYEQEKADRKKDIKKNIEEKLKEKKANRAVTLREKMKINK